MQANTLNVSPKQLSAFLPDADRANRIDQQVRDGLADSLTTIFGQLGVVPALQADSVNEALDRIRRYPISPRLMATYADLVEALYADDDALACSLVHDVLNDAPSADALRVVTLADRDLGAGQTERYARYALAESINLTLAPVNEDIKAAVSGLLDSAMDLLQRAAPELAEEIRALVRELVLVREADAGSDGFDGATTFYLWGALFLNATRIENRVQLAVAIVHEAAHAFLFGVNMGARLTENVDEEVCASPLRAEPRPIEGVFHANFVLARMIYGLDRLLACDLLSPGERLQVETMLSQNIDSFRVGMKSLAGVAKLSPLGAQLLREAEAYVNR